MQAKRNFKTFLLLCVTLILVSMVVSQTLASKSLGHFLSLSGDIKYNKSGNTEYKDVTNEEALKLELDADDKIITMEATTGEIMTSFGARISLVKNTEMQLGSYNIRINKGGAWINYKPVKDNTGNLIFTVNTPVGTIGVRGTTFAVCVKPEEKKLLVQVKEGVVSVDSDKGNAVINGGEMLIAESGKTIGVPTKTAEGYDVLSPEDKSNIDNTKINNEKKDQNIEMQQNNSNTNPWSGIKNKK